jgi:hypothetical protein
MSEVIRLKKDRVATQETASQISTGNSSEELESIRNAMQFAKHVQMEFASKGDFFCAGDDSHVGSGLSLRPGNASLDVYAPLVSFPRLRRKQLERVDYWIAQDDLLTSLLQVKVDFTVMGMALRPKMAKKISTGNSDATKTQSILDRILLKWDFVKIAEDLLMDWYSKDTMILYWKIKKEVLAGEQDEGIAVDERSKEQLLPGVLEICSLNPAECDWQNSFGQDILRYKIPEALRMQIVNATNKSGEDKKAALQALINSGVELKYIEAVLKGEQWVTLNREDGDNWLIITRARKRHGIARPSMCNIFMPLEIRKAVSEGDFATSFLMKHFILHVKTGESITQGPLAGQRLNWAKEPDINKLNDLLKNTAKSSRVVSNHTVVFDFIFPPKEMWDGAKYENAENRILNFVGLSRVLMSGQGGTNAGGFIGIKRMTASMWSARRKIYLILFNFFDDPEIRKIVGLEDDVDVNAIFDENALKEPRQLLQEVQFLVEDGILDPAIALSELGRDPDTNRVSKLASIEENKKSKLWEPIYTKGGRDRTGQNRKRQQAPGRPANDGTTPGEETRTQSATTS